MSLIDDDQIRIAELHIPLDPPLDRLTSLQHDHLSDTEQLTIEMLASGRIMWSTVASLPPLRHAYHHRLYVDLLWSAARMVNCLAHVERKWHDSRAIDLG